jgi:hypothetical protein
MKTGIIMALGIMLMIIGSSIFIAFFIVSNCHMVGARKKV